MYRYHCKLLQLWWTEWNFTFPLFFLAYCFLIHSPLLVLNKNKLFWLKLQLRISSESASKTNISRLTINSITLVMKVRWIPLICVRNEVWGMSFQLRLLFVLFSLSHILSIALAAAVLNTNSSFPCVYVEWQCDLFLLLMRPGAYSKFISRLVRKFLKLLMVRCLHFWINMHIFFVRDDNEFTLKEHLEVF